MPPDYDQRKEFWLLLVAVTAIKAVSAWLLLSVFANTEWMRHINVDVWTWIDFLKKCADGAIPFVDVRREYPVGAGLFYWLLSVFVDGRHADILLSTHIFVMSALDILNAMLLYRAVQKIAPTRAVMLALVAVVLPSALILSPVRFEALTITCVLVGILFHQCGRPYLASFAWSLGCTIKWFPVFLLAAVEYERFFVLKDRKTWIKTALILVATVTLVNAPFVLADLYFKGTIDDWAATYLFHVNRPLYWDTILGVWGLWYGTPWIEHYASMWSLGLMALAFFALPRLSPYRRYTIICLAMLVFNRVYSAQFNLWFYPVLLLAAADMTERGCKKVLICLLALDLANVLVYPFFFAEAYLEMGDFASTLGALKGGVGTVLFSGAILVRGVVILVLGWFLLKPINPRSAATLAASPPNRT